MVSKFYISIFGKAPGKYSFTLYTCIVPWDKANIVM